MTPIAGPPVSGNFVLDYQLTDDIMLYASYRRGFKSGGFSAALTTCEFTCEGSFAPGPPFDGTRGDGTDLDSTFDEEILQSYEAGIKAMWFDRRLRFNLSTFFYDYDDLQVFTLELVGGQLVTVTENAADATIWGGEIDMMARPLPGLEIRAAGAWLSTEYKDYVSATAEGDLSGNELIAAPNYTGSGSISYELNLRGGVLRGLVGASYSDEVFYLADNIKRARQGPVWLVNGNLSYLLPDERTEISVWVRNWNDKVIPHELLRHLWVGLGSDGVLEATHLWSHREVLLLTADLRGRGENVQTSAPRVGGRYWPIVLPPSRPSVARSMAPTFSV